MLGSIIADKCGCVFQLRISEMNQYEECDQGGADYRCSGRHLRGRSSPVGQCQGQHAITDTSPR